MKERTHCVEICLCTWCQPNDLPLGWETSLSSNSLQSFIYLCLSLVVVSRKFTIYLTKRKVSSPSYLLNFSRKCNISWVDLRFLKLRRKQWSGLGENKFRIWKSNKQYEYLFVRKWFVLLIVLNARKSKDACIHIYKGIYKEAKIEKRQNHNRTTDTNTFTLLITYSVIWKIILPL